MFDKSSGFKDVLYDRLQVGEIVHVLCCILGNAHTHAHQMGIPSDFTHVRYFFLTYQRIQDPVISMLARCQKNLSHIATHER